MPEKKSRRFSQAFKLSALARMEGCENVSALARELNVRRKLLYAWRDAYRAGGEEALRPPGRRQKDSVGVEARSGASVGGPPEQPETDELGAARRRIAQLERKVGRQALEMDFLGQALQFLETSRRTRGRTGGSASTASSGPGHSGKAD